MVDPKELRIGNVFYTLENKLTAVTDIILIDLFSNTIKYDFKCFGYNSNQVKPISINEEWLKRSGFIAGNRGLVKDSIEIEFIIPDLWRITYGSVYIRDIKYIHNLQNIYYALKGKELDFKI
jgi:hypothetical protein